MMRTGLSPSDDENREDEDERKERDNDGDEKELTDYDPKAYDNLDVNSDIKSLFPLITLYSPRVIDLEFKLKPFIPDYIPAVGDVDAFIKVSL